VNYPERTGPTPRNAFPKLVVGEDLLDCIGTELANHGPEWRKKVMAIGHRV